MVRITKEADVRRQELIDIGFELYMKNGMSGLNIKDIVSKANVATGLFYYYFKSKEEFVEEASNNFIIKRMEVIKETLNSSELTPIKKVKVALNEFWEYSEIMLPYKENSIFYTEQHYALTNKLLEQMYPFVLNTIKEGVAENLFHVSNPSLVAGFVLYGLSSILNSDVEVTSMTRKNIEEMVFNNLGISIEEVSYE
ncbi:MAG TPA: TetR/AcrR family transcriptional regulator [Candidatus Merdenecus merdavium]|nr:TetR/AcrR family transcriptional regulator [Candidatus Merdenecus merdavium]